MWVNLWPVLSLHHKTVEIQHHRYQELGRIGVWSREGTFWQVHRPKDQPASPDGFGIDPRLDAITARAPAASGEASGPQAMLKLYYPSSLDYRDATNSFLVNLSLLALFWARIIFRCRALGLGISRNHKLFAYLFFCHAIRFFAHFLKKISGALSNAHKCSAIISNAQQCSAMLKNAHFLFVCLSPILSCLPIDFP